MEVLMGKSSINGPFSMAMLNNQRVIYQCVIILHPSLGSFLHHFPSGMGQEGLQDLFLGSSGLCPGRHNTLSCNLNRENEHQISHHNNYGL